MFPLIIIGAILLVLAVHTTLAWVLITIGLVTTIIPLVLLLVFGGFAAWAVFR